VAVDVRILSSVNGLLWSSARILRQLGEDAAETRHWLAWRTGSNAWRREYRIRSALTRELEYSGRLCAWFQCPVTKRYIRAGFVDVAPDGPRLEIALMAGIRAAAILQADLAKSIGPPWEMPAEKGLVLAARMDPPPHDVRQAVKWLIARIDELDGLNLLDPTLETGEGQP
jgi:hypothetical protein